jgi:hypothetical protein
VYSKQRLATVVSMVEVCVKYEIHQIRKEAFALLYRVFPSTLAEWRERVNPDTSTDMCVVDVDSPQVLVDFIATVEAKTHLQLQPFLPVACLSLCRLATLEDLFALKTPPSLLARILIGRVAVVEAVAAKWYNADFVSSGDCEVVCKHYWSAYFSRMMSTSESLRNLDEVTYGKSDLSSAKIIYGKARVYTFSSLPSNCRVRAGTWVEMKMSEVWDALPRTFSGDPELSWDTLNNILESGMSDLRAASLCVNAASDIAQAVSFPRIQKVPTGLYDDPTITASESSA